MPRPYNSREPVISELRRAQSTVNSAAEKAEANGMNVRMSLENNRLVIEAKPKEK